MDSSSALDLGLEYAWRWRCDQAAGLYDVQYQGDCLNMDVWSGFQRHNYQAKSEGRLIAARVEHSKEHDIAIQ